MAEARPSDKSPDAFRTISEVADHLDLPQHVLRFWETRFSEIKPVKRAGGRRFYRPDDVDLLRAIRHLLYSEGYTIKGVQRILKDNGPRQVQAMGADLLEGRAILPLGKPAPDVAPAPAASGTPRGGLLGLLPRRKERQPDRAVERDASEPSFMEMPETSHAGAEPHFEDFLPGFEAAPYIPPQPAHQPLENTRIEVERHLAERHLAERALQDRASHERALAERARAEHLEAVRLESQPFEPFDDEAFDDDAADVPEPELYRAHAPLDHPRAPEVRHVPPPVVPEPRPAPVARRPSRGPASRLPDAAQLPELEDPLLPFFEDDVLALPVDNISEPLDARIRRLKEHTPPPEGPPEEYIPARARRRADPDAAARVGRVGPLTGVLGGPDDDAWQYGEDDGEGHHFPPEPRRHGPPEQYLPPHLRSEPRLAAQPVHPPQPVLSRDDVHRLQATLYELGECRRILTTALDPDQS